jgi:hypothetical protein
METVQETFLRLRNEGLITVEPVDYPPYWLIKRKGKEVKLVVGGSHNDRLRVPVYYTKKRKRLLYLHRLVYVHMTSTVVPNTLEIHHVNGDRFDNRWQNLIALSREDHLKLHAYQESQEAFDPF